MHAKKQTTCRKDSIPSVWNCAILLYGSSADGRGNKRRAGRKEGPATWKQLCLSRRQKQTGLLCHRCSSVVSLRRFVHSGVWRSCEFLVVVGVSGKLQSLYVIVWRKKICIDTSCFKCYEPLLFSRLALPDSVWGDLLHPSHPLWEPVSPAWRPDPESPHQHYFLCFRDLHHAAGHLRCQVNRMKSTTQETKNSVGHNWFPFGADLETYTNIFLMNLTLFLQSLQIRS